MPVVEVNLWKGISEEVIKKIISGITNVFVEVGIPQHAVEILIHEIPKNHWGIGGKTADEALPGEGPPQ